MPIRKSSVSGSTTPSGTTADRPANPSVGDTFNNGTLGVQEIYTASGWLPATGANDFNISITGSETVATFSKEYFAGSYTITTALNDNSLDIYLYNAQGNVVGYTNNPSISASSNFNKIVVIGGTVNDLLSFTYKTTFTTSDIGAETFGSIGPILKSLSTSILAEIDDSVTITGRNFDPSITAFFVGADLVDRPAKSIVYSSDTEIIVVRPDDLPPSLDPYTIRLEKPNTQPFSGTNSNKAINAISAGDAPAWQTASEISWNMETMPTFQLEASDADGPVFYSAVSSLPPWATLDGSTGIITANLTSNESGLDYDFTIRATDSGGNFADRLFIVSVSGQAPITNTPLSFSRSLGEAFSYQIQATDESTVTYQLLSGAFPAGISVNSSGLISGTIPLTAGSESAIIAATDSFGFTTNIAVDFTYRATGAFTTASIPASYIPGDTVTFSYTGSYQTFPKLNATRIRLEAVGAAGGGSSFSSAVGGNGGSSTGEYEIAADIYAYIGQGGRAGGTNPNGGAPASFNGGGSAGDCPQSPSNGRSGAGGGGTDFRTTINSSYQNRIIVAGGGGGGNSWSGDSGQSASGGHGGGSSGGNGGFSGQNSTSSGKGGTQIAGGAGGDSTQQSGSFGVGGNGRNHDAFDPGSPGGGGGYYGGGAGTNGAGGDYAGESGGGGGSGYIGGVEFGVTTQSGGPSGSSGDGANGSATVTILAV